MRCLVRCFDRFLQRCLGVFEFTQAEDCILRVQFRRIWHTVRFADGQEVRRGERVLLLHFWNERLPSAQGASDLVWATELGKALVRSGQRVAAWLAEDAAWRGVRAVGGVTALVSPDATSASARLMRRLGFELFPYVGRFGRFGEFWENFYAWLLIWTYNPASAKSHHLLDLRRVELWMPIAEFMRRYGPPVDEQPALCSLPSVSERA